MPGLPTVQASSQGWASIGSMWSTSLNEGWLPEWAIGSTGGFTVPAEPSSSQYIFYSTGDGTTGSGNSFYALGRQSRVVQGSTTFYSFVATALFSSGITTVGLSSGSMSPTAGLSTGLAFTSVAVGTESPRSLAGSTSSATATKFHREDGQWAFPGILNPALLWVSGPLGTIAAAQQANTGGTVTTRAYGIEMDTSAGASSWAKVILPLGLGAGGSPQPTYTKIRRFSAFVAPTSVAATFTAFLGIQDIEANAALVLTGRHIGFKLNPTASGNWFGTVANGTTESTLDTGVAAATGPGVLLSLTFDGTTATFYVNGVAKGTITTNLPTAIGTNELLMTAYIDNAAVANSRILTMSAINAVVDIT